MKGMRYRETSLHKPKVGQGKRAYELYKIKSLIFYFKFQCNLMIFGTLR